VRACSPAFFQGNHFLPQPRRGAPPELDKAPFFVEYNHHAMSAELILLEFLSIEESNYPEILNGSRQP
jgi:hypothetical protein